MSLLLRLALASTVLLGMTCTAGDYTIVPECAKSEQCGNNYDDDCDGIVDNPLVCSCTADRQCTLLPNVFVNDSSYPGGNINSKARCTTGIQRCINGQLTECQGGIQPIPEQCGNGIDDDCDGFVDEPDCISCIDGQTQRFYPSLSTLDLPKNFSSNSKCQAGTQICDKGVWKEKSPATISTATKDDMCDSKDDDCDGLIDEDVVFGSGPTAPKLGQLCWDSTQKGACRQIGTVQCETTANPSKAACIYAPRTKMNSNLYYRTPEVNVRTDSDNIYGPWDINCDGSVDVVYCISTADSCNPASAGSVIRTDRNMASADCLALPAASCASTKIVYPFDPGTQIQCGSLVYIYTCQGTSPCTASGFQTGYAYCR